MQIDVFLDTGVCISSHKTRTSKVDQGLDLTKRLAAEKFHELLRSGLFDVRAGGSRTVNVVIEVKATAKLSDEKVVELVERLIDGGWEEAQASSQLEDFDDPDVELMLELEIGHPRLK